MVLDAAQGLTWEEAENALALALVRQKCFDPKTITELKAQMVKKSAALEFSQFKETFETLGGLENLKDWTLNRFKSRRPGLPFRGILLLGVPGTGKSHFAKALGNQVGWPCLSLNLGKVFGSLVGESEAKMREALKVVDAMAPCILFLDEIEKGLAGVGGGSTDGGTTQRVGGTFLNLAERSHLRGVRHRHLQRLLRSSPRNTPGWGGGTPSFLWIIRGPGSGCDILDIYLAAVYGSENWTSPKCRTWTVTAVRKSGRWPSRPLTTAGTWRRQPGSSSPFPGPRKTRWTVSGNGPRARTIPASKPVLEEVKGKRRVQL